MESCRHHCIALHCIALTLLISGCSTAPSPEPDLAAITIDRANGAKPTGSAIQEHDFGVVLAQGQTIRHEFTVKNSTDRPIRLIRSKVFTPCCSAIGPLPRSIPPNGVVKIPVILKSSDYSGYRRADFIVETDSSVQPMWQFGAVAQFHPTCEIKTLELQSHSIPVGQPGNLRYRIVCRRKGDEGLRSPTRVQVSGSARAEFLQTAEEEVQPSGIIESSVDVAVFVPANRTPGLQHSELLLHWACGKSQSFIVNWRVRPRVTARPASLVIYASRGREEREVIIASDDTPFRITGVSGPLLSGCPALPPSPSLRHVLQLALDPATARRGALSGISVSTDHPEQPKTDVRIVIVP